MSKPRKPVFVDPLAKDRSADIARMDLGRIRFTLSPKDTTVTLRLPASLVNGAKKVAKRKGVKYQAMMREAIADFLVKEGE